MFLVLQARYSRYLISRTGETALTTIMMVSHSDTFFVGKCIVASLSVVFFMQVEEEYAFEVCTMGCNRILSTPLARPGPNLKFEMNIV